MNSRKSRLFNVKFIKRGDFFMKLKLIAMMFLALLMVGCNQDEEPSTEENKIIDYTYMDAYTIGNLEAYYYEDEPIYRTFIKLVDANKEAASGYGDVTIEVVDEQNNILFKHDYQFTPDNFITWHYDNGDTLYQAGFNMPIHLFEETTLSQATLNVTVALKNDKTLTRTTTIYFYHN